MNIFNLIYLFGFLLAILSLINYNNKNFKSFLKFISLLTLLTLFILSGFRSINIGYDNIGHYQIFYEVSTGSSYFFEFNDIGYSLLGYLASFVFGYNGFIIVYSLILLIIFVYTAKTLSKNTFITLYSYYSIYFLVNNMARIRTAMAVLIGVLAIISLIRNKKITFFLLSLTAISFHFSAIILLPFYFLRNYELNNKRLIIISTLAIFIGFSNFLPSLVRITLSNNVLSNIDIFGIERIYNYTNSQQLVREGGYFGFAFNLLALFYILYFYNRYSLIMENQTKILMKAYYFGLIISFLFLNIPIVNNRLSMFFLVIQVYLFTHFYGLINNSINRFTFGFIHVLSVFLLGYLNFLRIIDNFVPYEFF